jgi:hypothetical protein
MKPQTPHSQHKAGALTRWLRKMAGVRFGVTDRDERGNVREALRQRNSIINWGH